MSEASRASYGVKSRQVRRTVFKSVGGGGPTKKGTFCKKGAPTKGNLSENVHFLDIGIYPYVVITLSGMFSMFVSLFTWSKILLMHHAFAVWCDRLNIYLRASEVSEQKNLRFEVAVQKNTSHKEKRTMLMGFKHNLIMKD